MFTFKLYDDCDVFGRSRDKIDSDLKRQFHYSIHCEGLEELDNKVFVWVNENIIQFFSESNEISEAQRGRVISAISLTNPKDTGFDLLFFAEHIKNNSLIPTRIGKKTKEFLQRAETIFNDFPFFNDKNRKQRKNKEYNNPDRVFMRLCLLEFLLAVDTHDEIFAVYPGFDELRKKLRESKVYLLLCSKLRYCMYHYKGRNALNPEEYTFVVSKYADLLMDSDFNKIVPPGYFDEPRFLYNPEFELKEIMKRKDSGILEDRVRQKITNFFLTKHAVIESSYGNVRPHRLSLSLKLLHMGLMLVIVIWSLLSLSFFDRQEDIINFFYDNKWWKLSVVLCLILEVVFAVKTSKSPILHPRIFVALMIGWFTIAVSEDLIKSQLDIGAVMVLTALVAVSIIVCLMLRGEVRQHSPYYRWPWKAKLFPKSTSVLVYAMFWNLLLGVIMQQVTYSPLLKTSGAVPSVVLNQLPNEVEVYKKSLETCISMLDDYDRSMEGIVHDNGRADFSSAVSVRIKQDTTLSFNAFFRNGKTETLGAIEMHDAYLRQIGQWLQMAEQNMGLKFFFHNDTCWITDDALRLAFCWEQIDEKQSIIRVLENDTTTLVETTQYAACIKLCRFVNIHRLDSINGYVRREVERNLASVKDIIRVLEKATTPPVETTHYPGWEKLCRFVDSRQLASIKKEDVKMEIERNLDSVREIKNSFRVMLLETDRFMVCLSDPDTLMEWTKYNNVPGNMRFNSGDYYLAFLEYEARTKHYFSRDIIVLPQVRRVVPVFPRMLVFHSLIVLLIAFVGQLIISDKSVTEPL